MKSTPEFDLYLLDVSILIVDDINEARGFLADYLTRKGATVLGAKNGDLGLQLFEQHRPDIVITDIRMPVLDGIAMIEAIRKIAAETPVIFMTAYSDTEWMQRAVGLAATEYLIKPITPEKLLKALHKASKQFKPHHELHFTLDTPSSAIDRVQNESQQLSNTISHLIGDNRHASVNVLHRSKEVVSGDFHCVVQYRNSLYVLLADGLGHGLPAILPALELPNRFRKLAGKGFSLARIADELNQIVGIRGLCNHFVAATLVRIDAETNLIEVMNCGNPDALLVNPQGQLLHGFRSNHVPWGIVKDDDFTPSLQEYRFQAPFKLYVFSDGLTETLESVNQESGIELFGSLLATPASDILHYLHEWLQTLPADQVVDDITLLEITTPPITNRDVDGVSSATEQPICKSIPIKELSVLFVEDDPDTQTHLSRFLSRKVGRVHTASNGQEGLQLFIKHRPSMVITDIHLPTMSGLEMVERIREIDHEVPIILTSGYDSWHGSSDKLESLLELTINKFLPKPLDREKLLAAIQYCFDKAGHISSLHLSNSLFMTSPLAMAITDQDRNFIAINPSFTAITEYTQEDVQGCNPRILSSGMHDAEFYRNMWTSIDQTGQWSGEVWNRRKNGEPFLEWINITAIYDQAGKISHYASIFSDITQRARAEEKIRHLAHHDPLTGLPNRTLFFDRLGQALLQMQREQGRLAIIYVDVDHFKMINDTLGHGIGDELICKLARTLESVLRESDTVCRLGGDEFAILLSDLESSETTAHLAGKVFHAISKTYQLADKELRVGVSMGISQYPRDGDDAETLIKRADNAMYQAKKKGRNRYQLFNYALEQKAERRMSIQQSLHKALEKNEFYVHYQPKYALDERRIVGAEALLRWRSSELGELSPNEFVPIAEETGFIIELGEWVIAQVCRDLSSWQELGVELVPVAVNISPIQFHRSNLQLTLLQQLTNHRLPVSLLQIELTEGVVMNSQKNTLKKLQAIKDMGIAISIDDFGTGYSSLSYLRKLPIDELKIDRSFIMEIIDESSLADGQLTAIPSTIIELAKKLKLKLVAEGVETKIQSVFLQQNGCSVIQGYLFSKPVSNEAMLALLTGTKQRANKKGPSPP